jgi:hypothetical protein
MTTNDKDLGTQDRDPVSATSESVPDQRDRGTRLTAGSGSGGALPPQDELTPQQHRGIAALLAHPTITAAAAEIGVHPRTISRWLKENAFWTEYLSQMSELQLELWRQMLSVREQVWNRFLELVASADERVALRATTWFLDRMLAVPAIHSRSGHDPTESALGASPRLLAFLAMTGEGDVSEGGVA